MFQVAKFSIHPLTCKSANVFTSLLQFFFVMLLCLGIDSQFCGVESLMTGLVDNWPDLLRPHRKKFTLGMTVFMCLLGLPMITRVITISLRLGIFDVSDPGRDVRFPVDGFLCC